MLERLGTTERERVLLVNLERLYLSKAEQYNEIAPADCGVSSGEIDDGLSQLYNRIEKSLNS